MKQIDIFKNDESGAVTVDWVVLTAAIVGIAIAVITLISGGINSASEDIDAELETAGAGWDFRASTATTIDEYMDDFTNIRNDSGEFNDTSDPLAFGDSIGALINADAPGDDYVYNGTVTSDGYPVYANDTGILDTDTGLFGPPVYSVNGVVTEQGSYDNTGDVDHETYFPPAT